MTAPLDPVYLAVLPGIPVGGFGYDLDTGLLDRVC